MPTSQSILIGGNKNGIQPKTTGHFNSNRRFYRWASDFVNILRTWQAEIKTVEDLLDEIESENLYQVLITVNGCTLQIVCLLYTTLMSIFFYAFYRLEYFKYYRQEARLFAIIQSV